MIEYRTYVQQSQQNQQEEIRSPVNKLVASGETIRSPANSASYSLKELNEIFTKSADYKIIRSVFSILTERSQNGNSIIHNLCLCNHGHLLKQFI